MRVAKRKPELQHQQQTHQVKEISFLHKAGEKKTDYFNFQFAMPEICNLET